MSRTGFKVLGLALALALAPSIASAEAEGGPVFEMRTYTTHEGRLDDLHQRFIDHTLTLFERHGMRNVGYWMPTDPERSQDTLIFILKHDSAEAAEQNWQGFLNDPEWQAAYAKSHEDGPLVKHIDSVFMQATDYSAIQE